MPLNACPGWPTACDNKAYVDSGVAPVGAGARIRSGCGGPIEAAVGGVLRDDALYEHRMVVPAKIPVRMTVDEFLKWQPRRSP
jgi:hypothetical protein